LTQLFFMLHNI